MASAANWQWIISTDEHGFFFDTQSLRYTTTKYGQWTYPTTAEYWMKVVYTPSSAAELVSIYDDDRLYAVSYSINKEQLDFYYKTVSFEGKKTFYNGEGKVVATYISSHTDEIIPGTINDAIMKHIKEYCIKRIRT
jgi:hypothetical protein